jgi:uncharacterized protein YdaU (DUF1376 family)
MKAKTILDLLNLSSNIYLIARDKELIEKIASLSEKGKEKINDLKEEFFEGEDEGQFMNKLLSKLNEAKQELETKIEEVATSVYKKMNIAHTDDVQILNNKIEQLQKDLALIEARISRFETPSANIN